MPFALDPKSIVLGVLLGVFVVPMVHAKVSAARAK